VWVFPFPGKKRFRDGSVAGPNGARGGVCAQTQWGLGLGPFVSGPKIGLGVSPFLSRPKGVWVWVLPCPYPKGKGFGMGSEFGPKEFEVTSWTQNEFGCGSLHFRGQEGWGMAPWPDPMGLRAGSLLRPKGFGFGSFCFRTQ